MLQSSVAVQVFTEVYTCSCCSKMCTLQWTFQHVTSQHTKGWILIFHIKSSTKYKLNKRNSLLYKQNLVCFLVFCVAAEVASLKTTKTGLPVIKPGNSHCYSHISCYRCSINYENNTANMLDPKIKSVLLPVCWSVSINRQDANHSAAGIQTRWPPTAIIFLLGAASNQIKEILSVPHT